MDSLQTVDLINDCRWSMYIRSEQKYMLLKLVNEDEELKIKYSKSRERSLNVTEVKRRWNLIALKLNALKGSKKTGIEWRREYLNIIRKNGESTEEQVITSDDENHFTDGNEASDPKVPSGRKKHKAKFRLIEKKVKRDSGILQTHYQSSSKFLERANELTTAKLKALSLLLTDSSAINMFYLRNSVKGKLRTLLAANDKIDRITLRRRMSIADWVLFDNLLVHENIDVIDMTNRFAIKDRQILHNLFNLVEKYRIEFLVGVELAEAWVALTLEYNQDNRECTPMLLQRRWYQLKLATRQRFYRYHALYQAGLAKVQGNKPTPLQTAIVTRYKSLVLSPCLTWEELIKNGLVILREQFESIAMNKSQQTEPTMTIEKRGETETETVILKQYNQDKYIDENRFSEVEKYSDENEESDIMSDDSNTMDSDSAMEITIENKNNDNVNGIDIDIEHTNNDTQPAVIEIDIEPPCNDTQPAANDIDIEHPKNDIQPTMKKIDIEPSCNDIQSAVTDIDIEHTTNDILPALIEIDIEPPCNDIEPAVNEIDIEPPYNDIEPAVNEIYIEPPWNDVQSAVNKIEIDMEPEVMPALISNDITFSEEQEEPTLPKITNVFGNVIVPIESSTEIRVAIEKDSNADSSHTEIQTNTAPNISNNIDEEFQVNFRIENIIDGIVKNKVTNVVCEPTTEVQIKEELMLCKKLLMVPVVNTVKLDDMGILPIHLLAHVDNKTIIDMIQFKSKPKAKTVEKQLTCKNKSIHKRVDLSSLWFKSSRNRTYNSEQLANNPDFNIILKKLNRRFFTLKRNRMLLKSCKPLCVYVDKSFENQLVNGRLYLKHDRSYKRQEQENWHNDSSASETILHNIKDIEETESSTFNTVTPKSYLQYLLAAMYMNKTIRSSVEQKNAVEPKVQDTVLNNCNNSTPKTVPNTNTLATNKNQTHRIVNSTQIDDCNSNMDTLLNLDMLNNLLTVLHKRGKYKKRNKHSKIVRPSVKTDQTRLVEGNSNCVQTIHQSDISNSITTCEGTSKQSTPNNNSGKRNIKTKKDKNSNVKENTNRKRKLKQNINIKYPLQVNANIKENTNAKRELERNTNKRKKPLNEPFVEVDMFPDNDQSKFSKQPLDRVLSLGNNKIILTTTKFPKNFIAFRNFKHHVQETLILPNSIRLLLLPNGQVVLELPPQLGTDNKTLVKLNELVTEFNEQHKQKKKNKINKKNSNSMDLDSVECTKNENNFDTEYTKEIAKSVILGNSDIDISSKKLNDNAVTSRNNNDIQSKEKLKNLQLMTQAKDDESLARKIKSCLGPLLCKSLYPITLVSELKYAYSNHGIFFQLDLNSGSFASLNIRLVADRVILQNCVPILNHLTYDVESPQH